MGGAERPTRDELHRIAANERRRRVLAALRGAEAWLAIDELASRLPEHEPEPAAAESDRGRSEIEVELVHHHLPMLHDAGLIEFDPERRRIRPTERLERATEIVTDGISGTARDACR